MKSCSGTFERIRYWLSSNVKGKTSSIQRYSKTTVRDEKSNFE